MTAESKKGDDAPATEAAESTKTMDSVEAMTMTLLGGEEAEARSFTLEGTKAKEHLQTSLLFDPYAYVLLFVRAAMKRKAASISFTFHRSGMEMTFDGSGFRRDDLERVYEAPFDGKVEAECPGLRELALGLSAVLRLSFGLTLTTKSHDGHGARFVLETGKNDRIEPASASPGTHIRVIGKVDRSLWTPARDALRPEEHYVRQRCRFSHAKLSIDGRDVTCALPSMKDAYCVTAIDARGVRGVAGLLPLERVQGAVLFMMDGVVVAEERYDKAECGFVALVAHDGLRLDASEASVVQNETYHEIMTVVEETYVHLRHPPTFMWLKEMLDRRTTKEIRRFSTSLKIRKAVCAAAVTLAFCAAGAVSAVGAAKTDLFRDRPMPLILAAIVMGFVALLLMRSVSSSFLSRWAARSFHDRYPPDTPIRTLMELDEMKPLLEKHGMEKVVSAVKEAERREG